MTPSQVQAKARYGGHVVQKRAGALVSESWGHPGSPHLIVRAEKGSSIEDVGRIAAILHEALPQPVDWIIVRHGDFRSDRDVVSVITDQSIWHATKDGLVTRDVERMPTFELQDIEEEMSLLPTPTDK